MGHIVGLLVSQDDAFGRDIGRVLRAGPTPVSLVREEGKSATAPDLIIVDTRGSTAVAMQKIEQLRVATPSAAIFAVARAADPQLILEAMRAGANEFLTWPSDEATIHAAVGRVAGRLETKSGAKTSATTIVFIGAKGGVGTTTLAVNCAVELARITARSTVIADLQPGFGEVGLFLGVRPKYTIVDAFENLQRLDREFLRELVTRHKSGLDVLAGSDQFDRPSGVDGPAIEELFRFLGREYQYVVYDAGCHISSCALSALYTADQIYVVATPDVPSVRNAQRVVDQVRRLGACGERVRLLLNRGAEPLQIPQKHIEDAVGCPIHHIFCSDYKTVAAALNSGVPLAGAGTTDIARQVGDFARRILDPTAEPADPRSPALGLGLHRIASLW